MPYGVIPDGVAVTEDVVRQPYYTFIRPLNPLSRFLKRMVDMTGAIFALMLFSPVMLIVALLVGLTSRGPIFYKSLRIGRSGREFHMYKFRTMVPDAERMRSALARQHRMTGQLFKLPNDNRITPIGGVLRKYSLDELPQLFNVLRGEMSLVGPRPFVPDESRLFQPPYTARFTVTPGMTGPWQVGGRSDLPFEDLCRLELDYVRYWSLWQDFKILLKTVPSVLFRQGAY